MAGGLAVAVSGVLLDLAASGALGSNTADTFLGRFGNGLFAVGVLGLMCGMIGLRVARVGGSGWLPRIGAAVTLLGLLLWAVGGFYLTADASAEQVFTPAGGFLASIGMVVYGIAVLRAGAPAGPRRFVPLLVGVWFFVQLPIQVAFFLSVGGSPLYVLLLGVVGLLWALTGWLVRSQAGDMAAPA